MSFDIFILLYASIVNILFMCKNPSLCHYMYVHEVKSRQNANILVDACLYRYLKSYRYPLSHDHTRMQHSQILSLNNNSIF